MTIENPMFPPPLAARSASVFRLIVGGGRPRTLKPRVRVAPGLVAVLLTQAEASALARMSDRLLQGDKVLRRDQPDDETMMIIDGLLQLQAAGRELAISKLRSSFRVVETEVSAEVRS